MVSLRDCNELSVGRDVEALDGLDCFRMVEKLHRIGFHIKDDHMMSDRVHDQHFPQELHQIAAARSKS